jgi:hypothetical protein
MGQPNIYFLVSARALKRKDDVLISPFGRQRSKQWFDPETFIALARLRGTECCAAGALCGSSREQACRYLTAPSSSQLVLH